MHVSKNKKININDPMNNKNSYICIQIKYK